jgi:uncharacterized protein (TIGR02265 family)
MNLDPEAASPGDAPRFGDELQALRELIARVPKYATVKGMYIKGFLESLDREGITRPTQDRFIAFRDYPLTLFMSLLLGTTQEVWPDRSPRESLRAFGRFAFPTFASSMVGRVIFAVAGRDWKHALTLTDKAYSHSLNPATTRLVEVTGNSATLEFRDVWNFCDCYQLGVFEGAMAHYEVNGSVTLRAYPRPCDADLLLRWD